MASWCEGQGATMEVSTATIMVALAHWMQGACAGAGEHYRMRPKAEPDVQCRDGRTGKPHLICSFLTHLFCHESARTFPRSVSQSSGIYDFDYEGIIID